MFHIKPYKVKCPCYFLKSFMKQSGLSRHRLLSVYTSTPPIKQEKKQRWTSHNVRNTFIDFFCNKHGHLFVPSSSVIPSKDQGTLFTNAGMNQFRKIFEGTVDPKSDLAQYKKVSNSQKCVRVGGKHNDLEEVGKDVYHHTYFEMLGNWSFGDYFKKEACKMALTLLTEVYNLPVDRLYFTYFKGDPSLGVLPDDEVKEVWLSLGIPESRILPFGVKDNFWEMGETGPCGPCTEIHYNYSGKPDVGHLVNIGTPDMMEIWNLVFMQYDRKQDGTLEKLPQCHVDTGMGLERILAILQGVKSNYDTDLFVPFFQQIQKISKCRPYSGYVGIEDKDGIDAAYRIVADHVRMLSVSIADGVLPSRVKLGYALRKIQYRCINKARMLGVPHGELSTLVDIVTESLGEAYPEISKNQSKVREVFLQAEEWYSKFIIEGNKTFGKFLKNRKSTGNLTGQEIAWLTDGKYGPSVPVDVIANLAESHGLEIDIEDYHEINKTRNIVKTTDDSDRLEISADLISRLNDSGIPYTDDHYKYKYTAQNGVYDFNKGSFEARVVGLVSNGKLLETVTKGDNCGILLDKTSFYSENGGQVSDVGKLNGDNWYFNVTNVQKKENYVIHFGTVEDGKIQVGNKLTQLDFNENHRIGCMRNHTATHLLNSSLRNLFGHVQQLGSTVDSERSKFKFSCHVPLTTAHLDVVQNDILNLIQAKLPVTNISTSASEVMKNQDIIKIPNEIDSQTVCVINVNAKDSADHCNSLLSASEVCVGTHVMNTSDLESFCIIKLNRLGTNNNRIVCVTGDLAKEAYMIGKQLTEMYDKFEQELPYLDLSIGVKSINLLLRNELIPHQIREDISNKVSKATLRKLKNQKMHEEAKALEQEVGAAVQSGSSIHVLNFKNPKTVQKILVEKTVNHPVIFLSENDYWTMAVVHCPQNAKETVLEYLEKFKLVVPEVDLKLDTKATKDFVYLRVKNRKCLDILKSEFNKFVKEIV